MDGLADNDDPEPSRDRLRMEHRETEAAQQQAELEDLRRRLARAKQQQKRARAREKARNKAIAERNDGTYFAIIDRVGGVAPQLPATKVLWADVDLVQGTTADFDALKRGARASDGMILQHWPPPRRSEPFKPYRLTEDNLDETSKDPADDAGRSRTSHADTNAKINLWPKDIFLWSAGADIAHLVPASVYDANRWWFVADLLFSRERRHWTREARLKAIHGAKYTTGNQYRISHTGIKHLCTNKVKLGGQGRYFDTNPCLVVVPIMTVTEVQGWRGTSYDAIALIGAWVGADLKDVNHDTYMDKAHNQVATEEEVETATELLRTCLKAIHFAVKSASDQPRAWPGVDQEWLTREESGRRERVVSDHVAIPRGFQRSARVLKISFKGHNGQGSGHLAPDPILLAVKAAINFARRHETVLLEPPADPQDEDDLSEGHQIEMEMCWAWQEKLLRPPDDRDELARRLGQAE